MRLRRIAIIAAHTAAFAAIYFLTYAVRFDGDIPALTWRLALDSAPLVVGLKISVFVALGSHRGWWRYATFADAVNLAQSATLGALAVTFVGQFVLFSPAIPRSVILMDWAATIFLIGGARATLRLVRQSLHPMDWTQRARRTVVVGTSEASVALIGELYALPKLGMKVIGILDPDRSLQGHLLHGVRILGSPANFERIAAKHRVETVLVPTPAVSPRDLRSLVTTCHRLGVNVQVVPGFDALLTGKVTVRPRTVDINDLLCRAPVQLDSESIGNFLSGKVILVTGAAGSIGSELCRQILSFQPATLVLLDHCENGIFHLERELEPLAANTRLNLVIASITDPCRLRSVFQQFQPDVVLHAAAHKHVPMMEANPGEAVKNNVFGTRTLVDEAVRSGVEAFVMISTDKAVRPTSVMGACKRLAEMYVQSITPQCATRLVTVRFGNVLGSNGSVVPLFQEQIRLGSPVTVTHPDMTRYFMTIPEAAQLVLQAGALGRGGEIFVLDMGEPVKIIDLANDLIRLSGHSKDEVEIVFSGLRPGEKLFEELYDDHETQLSTPHPKIFLAQHRSCDPARFRAQLENLVGVVNGTSDQVIDALRAVVPEYREHSKPDDSWDRLEHRKVATTVAGGEPDSLREGRFVNELFSFDPINGQPKTRRPANGTRAKSGTLLNTAP